MSQIEENSSTMDTTSPQKSKWDSKNPVTWSEVRRAVVPQDLPDWPLLSQGINYLTCKFCNWMCFSTINFRRHECSHVQRRNNPNWFDDAKKKNSLLKKFWHERSRDFIKDVLSLQDVELKGITWHKIVEELTSMPEPNFRAPPSYYKARDGLLNTIKSEEPEFSISPEDFVELISRGSEKTIFYNDTDEPLENHVFKDAEKIALQPENLVATACFFLEQKLRKVWHAHLKDETASLQNKLIMEEEDEKTRQLKTEGNKVDGKKKKNKKNKPKKHIVEDKSEAGNLGQTSDTQQSRATSRPEVPISVEENSLTLVAQLEHLPDASHIRDAKQEDGECKQNEEGSKEQKSEKGKKKKNKKNKKPKKQIARDKSEEGNLGQTSDTQQSTATSRPEVPTSVEEDSQTPVAQLENLADASKREDGECKQEEEGSKQQKSEDKIGQDMTEASDSLPDGGGPPREVLQILLPDASGPSSEDPIRTRVTELVQLPSNAEQVLHSDAVTKSSQKEPETKELSCQTEICSSNAPSQVCFEDQLPPEVYSDHEDHELFRDRCTGRKFSKAVQKSSHMRRKSAPPRMQRVPKVVIPTNIERGK